MKKSIFVLKPGDIAPAVAVLMVFFAPLFANYNRNSLSSKATIEINNQKLIDIDMSVDAFYDAGPMKIEVKEKKIRVIDSDCPGRLCMNTGAISSPGSVIVCAPNKTVIKIDNKVPAAYDAVSY